MYCYCSICRKTTGGAFGCNIMGKRDTLRVTRHEASALLPRGDPQSRKRPVRSEGERWFCGECGTHLYVLDDRWPEGVWPNAGAIDTPLPVAARVRAPDAPLQAEVGAGVGARAALSGVPGASIDEWHDRHGERIRRRIAVRSPS